MELRAWAALGIFVGVIVLIASGKVKATTATLLGAALMSFGGLVSGEQAVQAIDHDTIGLLVGMMIVVGILSKCGLFQYVAVKAVKVTGGSGPLILWAISLITMLLSAFLDNVTTMLLVTPVVLSLCDLISLEPLPLLLAEVFASNIGGTATLIGDPPNMIVGSVAGFSFNDFLKCAAPVAIVVWFAATWYLCFHFKKQLASVSRDATERLSHVEESRLITDKKLMIKSLVIMFLVLAGFVLQRQLHMEPASIALMAAAILLVISLVDEEMIIMSEVSWPTIIYFVSLFVMAGGLRATGVITAVAHGLISLLSGSQLLMLLGVLWVSGVACIFINNAAFVAIFVYVVAEMASATGMDARPLYWALALGACFGGNGSYLGAAANAVLASLAERNHIHVPFGYFMKLGTQIVLMSLVISSAAVYIIWKVA